MSTISSTTPRSANMISAIALAVALIALLAFVVAQSPVISVTGSQDVNSATQSYIAWAEAADSERTVVDSATRSYIAGAQYLLTAPAK